ncbi:MAG: glycosyltransferase [Clostridia bacterium]|nr:glycosyltransferase [Clostridia bacterium]
MISVIIPTYNRCELLLRAAESVLRQTYADLECIIVDDASVDGTEAAVRSLTDPRVRYVRQERNAGACAARNRGVDMARGEYVAFQDSDDVWHADKLEKQLALLVATGADVVACGMHRIGADGTVTIFPVGVPEGQLTLDRLLFENLCSTQCMMGKTEAFRSIRFDEDMPRLQDWDVMLRLTEQCRVYFKPEPLVDVHLQPDSISSQPGKLLTALTRLYGKFHGPITAPERHQLNIRWPVDVQWMRSIAGAAELCGEDPWTDELLLKAPAWVYRAGQAGSMGAVVIHPSGVPAAVAPGATHLYMNMAAFLPGPGRMFLPEPLLGDVLSGAYGRVTFADAVATVSSAVPAAKTISTGLRALTAWKGRRYAWDVLTGTYGGGQVAQELAALYLLDMPGWARELQGIFQLVSVRPVKRIGVYYHSLRGGGVQRTAAALIRLWAEMGYDVTLVTSSAPTAEDYLLPEGVQRAVVEPFDHTSPEKNRAHVGGLQSAAADLDLLVYHAWADPLILFDLLAVRSTGCRLIVHTHSSFTMPLLEPTMLDRFRALPDVYALADGVVTLSEADECYWRHCNPRVYRTVNPLTFDPAETPVNALAGQTILWAGRFSPEKRPMDAIVVLREVRRYVPDAKLILLGGGDAETEAELRRCADANGLMEQVEMPGFCQDTMPFYARADVFLCTSAYEGFCLTMAEAQTCGIPCVTYDMPGLTVLQGGGHVSVPQGDVKAAAKAIVRLLADGPYRRAMGQAARSNVEKNLNIDQRGLWQRIFAEQAMPVSPAMPVASSVPDGASAVMLQMLREHAAARCTGVLSSDATRQTAFVPMPKKGPLKRLRKKAATFLQVLLIDGPAGIVKVFRDKKG